MYQVRRGLGDTATITPANAGFLQKNLETIAACNSLAYYINPFCWGYSPEAWKEMAEYQPLQSDLPAAPAAIPSALSSVPAPLTQEQYDQETSGVLNAAMAQTQANTLASSQNQATVCGSGQTLADDGATCVSTTNWALWAAIAGVGVLVVYAAFQSSAPKGYGKW